MDSNAKFREIYSKLLAEKKQVAPTLTFDSRVLIVDGMNNFIRCWTAVPTLDSNGVHVGGLTGFLLSIGSAIRMLSPTRVIVVFDGKGGSARRRKLYPDYKNKRAMTVRLNRTYEDLTSQDGDGKEMTRQLLKLVECLRLLPVSMLTVDYIEADDTIAYLCTDLLPEKSNSIYIMSADKDFIQLVNDKVCIWNPCKKKVYGVQQVVDEYGIYPTNFPLFRMFDGDASDNIGGIKGIGRKTVIKRYPQVAIETKSNISEILRYAADKANEHKVYRQTIENKLLLERNYALMQLQAPDFSGILKSQIIDTLDNVHQLNKIEFNRTLIKYDMGFVISNLMSWLGETFNSLHFFAQNRNENRS